MLDRDGNTPKPVRNRSESVCAGLWAPCRIFWAWFGPALGPNPARKRRFPARSLKVFGALLAQPSPDPCTRCYAIVLPGRKSGFRAGFRPDSNRESLKIGPPSGRRPAGGPMLKLSRFRSPISGPETLLHNIGYMCDTHGPYGVATSAPGLNRDRS